VTGARPHILPSCWRGGGRGEAGGVGGGGEGGQVCSVSKQQQILWDSNLPEIEIGRYSRHRGQTQGRHCLQVQV
jgi:hypothetical protein